jgi:hypothetical protein
MWTVKARDVNKIQSVEMKLKKRLKGCATADHVKELRWREGTENIISTK